MPRYNPATIEPRWQKYWEENATFATPRLPEGEKAYVLDMFPYPSGDGLHVGHPEGYTATDIVCRYWRMRGKSVMHPMGFDAFGLPAEEHAIKTNTPPRRSTEQNIANFRRQLKMLGFSYDWSRELATTDVEYFRWTQWIFLQLWDTWYDPKQNKGRPITELPIPEEVAALGPEAGRQYVDEHRLAYQSEQPVNWCPALGTVLANEEVIDGKSERGAHPVERRPLRQWMLRITAYADRLEKDLQTLDWPESVKALQRNWIGRSTGAEVDFYIGPAGKADRKKYQAWRRSRASEGFPRKPNNEVLRVYTTRPDTLFGATYMVIAPEHPFVERLTTPEQSATVEAYCQAAAAKSDLDRTDLAKEKTGVFTGSHAVNPVNGEEIPIWIADYVLISYGTGAIMAVPAHDTRDFEFALKYGLPMPRVVEHPPEDGFSEEFLKFYDHHFGKTEYALAVYLPSNNPHSNAADLQTKLESAPSVDGVPTRELIEVFETESDGVYLLTREPLESVLGLNLGAPQGQLGIKTAYTFDGVAINSGPYDGLSTEEFKRKITDDLAKAGLGRGAVNYKLRDWLFSRQRFWGEPFPVLHELDEEGNPTGHVRTVPEEDLPVDLPPLEDFKPHGRPEPPLDKAPEDWLYPVIDGVKYKRETNTMPQWAGSCWYYLRFLDPKNDERFVDPEVERAWMPVDLYIGGAEHAVLHLLYARFWHKVLYDRGHVSTPEPFQKLINQGMILGEAEITGYRDTSGGWISADEVKSGEEGEPVRKSTGEVVQAVGLTPEETEKRGEGLVLREDPSVKLISRAYKMSKSRGNVVKPDRVVEEYGADSLRLYEMFMGPLEATKPWSMEGVNGVRNFLDRVWRLFVDERAEEVSLNPAVQEVEPTEEQDRTLHKTIQAVTEDLDALAFNTAIARMMEFVNFFTKQDPRPKSCLEPFVLLLSPFAPHLGEELWRLLGHEKTLAYEPWPQFDASKVKEDTVEIPVQINGKLRAKILVPADSDRAALEAAAKDDEKIAAQLAGKTLAKTIVVPGRMVNFVVKG